MKQKIKFELLSWEPILKQIILSAFLFSLFGVFTWMSCSGLQLIWYASRLPPFTPPLTVFFIIYISAYALLGVVFCVSLYTSTAKHNYILDALVAYLALLFWCPLIFFTGGIAAILSLILSGFYSTLIIIKNSASRVSVTVLAFSVVALILYSAYFSVFFIILN